MGAMAFGSGVVAPMVFDDFFADEVDCAERLGVDNESSQPGGSLRRFSGGAAAGTSVGLPRLFCDEDSARGGGGGQLRPARASCICFKRFCCGVKDAVVEDTCAIC